MPADLTDLLTIFIFVLGPGQASEEMKEQITCPAHLLWRRQATDQTDIISAVSEVGRTKDCTDNCESVSLSRLKQPEVKLGVAKHEWLFKSIRRMVIQHKIGT